MFNFIYKSFFFFLLEFFELNELNANDLDDFFVNLEKSSGECSNKLESTRAFTILTDSKDNISRNADSWDPSVIDVVARTRSLIISNALYQPERKSSFKYNEQSNIFSIKPNKNQLAVTNTSSAMSPHTADEPSKLLLNSHLFINKNYSKLEPNINLTVEYEFNLITSLVNDKVCFK